MSIASKYPTICQLLEGTAFRVVSLEMERSSRARLKSQFQAKAFNFFDLLSLLCGAFVPEWTDSNGTELEANLAQVVTALGLEKVRQAFRDKLLVQDSNALQDTCYEIAVTAKACAVLDKDSVDLERPIQEKAKNSDIYGRYHGNPVRIEVTVLHQPRPAPVDLEYVEIVQAAEVSLGFQIQMKSPITSKDDAARMKRVVEKLCSQHATAGGANVQVDDVHFIWKEPLYTCTKGSLPVESVMFYSDEDGKGAKTRRDILHGARSRLITPNYIKQDFPNPPGVFDVTDLPEFKNQHPVSKKIRDMIQGKLSQCEPGLINIVAFGNPDPTYDSEVQHALHGAPFVIVTPQMDAKGNRHGGPGKLVRAPKAPFNPPANLSEDEQMTFIDFFKPLSAVWHIRIGHSAKSEIIINPNANVALPKDLEVELLK